MSLFGPLGRSSQARNQYLDVLRAVAIFLVLIHHVAQMSPVARPDILRYTHLGAHGVDLFFVLSGWLIGGLFWREFREHGTVSIRRFWIRRWWRTIPPYLFALALAYAAVALDRQQKFDFGYLLFIQNYYEVVPFFLVSWSLCVEEHFYVVIPIVALMFVKIGKPQWLLGLCVLPLLLRNLAGAPEAPVFGYYLTASHLFADALLIGFALAYVATIEGVALGRLWPVSLVIAASSALGLAAELSSAVHYVIDPFLWACLFSAVLALVVDLPTKLPSVVFAPLQFVAIISYSIYLTHALVLHVANRMVWGHVTRNELAFIVTETGLVLGVGAVFFVLFERTALVLRDAAAPARSSMEKQIPANHH